MKLRQLETLKWFTYKIYFYNKYKIDFFYLQHYQWQESIYDRNITIRNKIPFTLSNGSSLIETAVLLLTSLSAIYRYLSLFIAIYQTFRTNQIQSRQKGLDVDKSSGIVVTYGRSYSNSVVFLVLSHRRGSHSRTESELSSCQLRMIAKLKNPVPRQWSVAGTSSEPGDRAIFCESKHTRCRWANFANVSCF